MNERRVTVTQSRYGAALRGDVVSLRTAEAERLVALGGATEVGWSLPESRREEIAAQEVHDAARAKLELLESHEVIGLEGAALRAEIARLRAVLREKPPVRRWFRLV